MARDFISRGYVTDNGMTVWSYADAWYVFVPFDIPCLVGKVTTEHTEV